MKRYIAKINFKFKQFWLSFEGLIEELQKWGELNQFIKQWPFLLCLNHQNWIKASNIQQSTREEDFHNIFYYIYFPFPLLIPWLIDLNPIKPKRIKLHPRYQIINLNIQLIPISIHLEHHSKIKDGWILFIQIITSDAEVKQISWLLNIKLKNPSIK